MMAQPHQDLAPISPHHPDHGHADDAQQSFTYEHMQVDQHPFGDPFGGITGNLPSLERLNYLNRWL